MRAFTPPLPIDDALPALASALRAGTAAVLQAPPGAGKTTRVPLALLDEPWLAQRAIVMLEPRRLAARAAAAQMARTLGERVGETVGYRVRLDTRVGPRTRVEVVTEGVLARMLHGDPALERAGLVIFDEFHERSLQADLGLALILQVQELLRAELRVLVMSATLDGAAVARLLPSLRSGQGPAPVVTCEGHVHPVVTHWRPRRADERAEAAVARVTREALGAEPGDVLAFLPGQGEIARAERLLREGALPADVRVHALYGNLPAEAQDAAVAPAPPNTRKVVLATSIAESSLTIQGVRVVIDAGLARVPRFSPRTGMTRLETVRLSRASADQRRGRAGRTTPGVCYRLWAEAEEAHLVPHLPPEMLDADLAPLALELADAGVRDPAELRWLDPPPAAAFAQARELLGELGALGADGRITAHGRRMAALATHPRLSHMVLEGARLGHADVACDLAALLGERDVVRADAGLRPDADVRLRLELLYDRDALADSGYARGFAVDRDALRRVREQAREWRRRVEVRDDVSTRNGAEVRSDVSPRDRAARAAFQDKAAYMRDRAARAALQATDAAGLLLALAYPDRVGRRRADGARYLLRNGRGAAFDGAQSLATAPWIVAAEVDGQGRESRIHLAAPLSLDDVLGAFGDQVVTEHVVEWDDASEGVHAVRRERLGAIVLREATLREVGEDQVAAVLVGALRARGLDALPWSREARRLLERMRFARLHDTSIPDMSEATLLASLDRWLGPRLHGLRRLDDVRRVDLHDALLAQLAWPQRARLDELAPSHWTVPTGSRIPIVYADPAAPAVAVRLQELFGLAETPRVGGGRVPLTLQLLSPAQRPVQVTRDLAGFWRSSYFDVRRDLRGRYPKHHWPDDPLAAAPTRRAKGRRREEG